MKVLLVYPNDRMDSLISVGISVLSAHLKAANHEVELYDTTFYDTGRKTGDFFREQLGMIKPVDLSKFGVERKKMSLNELQQDFRKKVIEYNPGLIGFSTLEITDILSISKRGVEQHRYRIRKKLELNTDLDLL